MGFRELLLSPSGQIFHRFTEELGTSAATPSANKSPAPDKRKKMMRVTPTPSMSHPMGGGPPTEPTPRNTH